MPQVVLSYKFLPEGEAVHVAMPLGAHTLSAAVKPGDHGVTLYALCDADSVGAEKEDHVIWCVGTGHNFPKHGLSSKINHIGMALDYARGLVWHVFEEV